MAPVVIMATNRGITRIRGTNYRCQCYSTFFFVTDVGGSKLECFTLLSFFWRFAKKGEEATHNVGCRKVSNQVGPALACKY
jgi:hypothetical protein